LKLLFYASKLNQITAILQIFGKAHLEGFGGIEGYKGKAEMYDFF
jgi:hypothetical protein